MIIEIKKRVSDTAVDGGLQEWLGGGNAQKQVRKFSYKHYVSAQMALDSGWQVQVESLQCVDLERRLRLARKPAF